MRVRVLRVSDMPHGVKIWVDHAPGRCTFYVDEQLMTAEGAALLAAAATLNATAVRVPRQGAAW